MNYTRTGIIRILVLAVIVIVLVAFHLRSKIIEGSVQKEARRTDGIAGLFQFMTFEPDDETTQPLDLSKINSYEIEEEKFIKNVLLEKDPVCTGEDFLVTVEASNPNGPDSNLVVRIGNKPGNPAIMRFTRAGEREFYVVVRDEGKHIEYKKVKVEVRDCADRPSVFLRSVLHGTRPEVAEYEVTDITGLSGSLSFEWDFGDGSRLKTSAPYATHNYGLREQNRFLSTFLTKVTVIDSRKVRAEGRTTISLPNIHFVSKMMGNPIVPVVYNRFPEISGGRYETKITMKNIFEEAVEFDEAEVEYRTCDTAGSPVYKTVAAGSLISSTSIPASSVVEDRIVLNRSSMPKGTCNVVIKLTGKMPGDNTVTASIYLDIPPAAGENVGDKEEGKSDRVVTDKTMQEKLNKAAAILGKDRPITPDDIKRLEKEGKI